MILARECGGYRPYSMNDELHLFTFNWNRTNGPSCTTLHVLGRYWCVVCTGQQAVEKGGKH